MAIQPVYLRAGFFISALLIFGIIEAMLPWRRQMRGSRSLINLALGALDAVILKVVLPTNLVMIAHWAQYRQFGLLHHLSLPRTAGTIIALLVLDLVIYCQHVVVHKVPLLWRIHKVHHTDRHLDVTSSVRFHPLEILFSFLLKALAVLSIGASVWAVIIFEILLNASSVFTHANLRLPAGFERLLRALLVTPAMHRIHHSSRREEHDTNFGFSLSIWDRLCGTYLARPGHGEDALNIGLDDERLGAAWLDGLLLLPFRKKA